MSHSSCYEVGMGEEPVCLKVFLACQAEYF